MLLSRPARARAVRRSFPIRAYVGPNGGGKSLAMVNDIRPSLEAGRRVVSTVKILGDDGQPHPLWVPLQDFRTLLDVERCDVLLDEVTGVASSRSAGNVIPPAVLNLLMQLRRRDVTLSLTAPAWNRAEKVIREVTQSVTLCQGFAPKKLKGGRTEHDGPHLWPADQLLADRIYLEHEDIDQDGVSYGLTPLGQQALEQLPDGCPILERHHHDESRLWAPKRAFFWRTYDAFVFDEWTTAKRQRIKPVTRQLFWRPGSWAESHYDTFDQVLSVAAVTDAGACVDCGGTRNRPKCQCPTAITLEHVGRVATAEARP
jgi:hypothetical protein